MVSTLTAFLAISSQKVALFHFDRVNKITVYLFIHEGMRQQATHNSLDLNNVFRRT